MSDQVSAPRQQPGRSSFKRVEHETREVIAAMGELHLRVTSPPFLCRVGDGVCDFLIRYLADPDRVDLAELRAVEDIMHAAAEWRIENHGGTDPYGAERHRLLDLLSTIRTQIAKGSAPRGATRHFPGSPRGGTVRGVPALPDETARDRRRRIIGENITRFREAADLSKSELARRLGIDRRSVVRWETGGWEPSPDHLENLAEALRVPVHEFYREQAAAA